MQGVVISSIVIIVIIVAVSKSVISRGLARRLVNAVNPSNLQCKKLILCAWQANQTNITGGVAYSYIREDILFQQHYCS